MYFKHSGGSVEGGRYMGRGKRDTMPKNGQRTRQLLSKRATP